MKNKKPYYRVVFETNNGWSDLEFFDTLKEAKVFANEHRECCIDRWYNEYDEDLSFIPIFINCKD